MRSSEGSKDQANPGKCQHWEIRKGKWSRRETEKVDGEVGRRLLGWRLSPRKKVVREEGLTQRCSWSRRDKAHLSSQEGTRDSDSGQAEMQGWVVWVLERVGGLLFCVCVFFFILALHHKHYPMSLKMFLKRRFWWRNQISWFLSILCFMGKIFLFFYHHIDCNTAVNRFEYKIS